MLLLLTIKLAITLLVFATDLSATREDLFWIWRHPPLLARSFLAMYIPGATGRYYHGAGIRPATRHQNRLAFSFYFCWRTVAAAQTYQTRW